MQITWAILRPGTGILTIPHPRVYSPSMAWSSLEGMMNPETLEAPLTAAMAAARRVLLQAIDLRFNLDEAAEAASGGSRHLNEDLQRLRAASLSLQVEIERIAAALEPSFDGHGEILEEEQEEVMMLPGL